MPIIKKASKNEVLRRVMNGNTMVEWYADGTRIRYEPDSGSIPDMPESMDLKITNKCDNPHCMKWCHEKSNPKGLHADLDKIAHALRDMSFGELAIGGGNPLCHPDLMKFLQVMADRGVICNLTVNQYHASMPEYLDQIEKYVQKGLIKGLGISLTTEEIETFKKVEAITPHMVVHVIAGVHDPRRVLNWLIPGLNKPKVLILGYKDWGNGVSFAKSKLNTVSDYKQLWAEMMPEFLKSPADKLVLAFDNLAVDQLKMKNLVDQKTWDSFYAGRDGENTLYINGPEHVFARSSTSPTKHPITDSISLKEMFTLIRARTVSNLPH